MEKTHAPEEIIQKTRARFTRIAKDPSSEKRFPVGLESAKHLGYDADEIDSMPDSVTESFAGVGCPIALGPINEGETVLDLGCGAGLDSLLAARRVGPEGRVIGIDMTPDMVRKASENGQKLGVENVEFRQGSAEQLSLGNTSVDIVLSNGVINLCPDKGRVVSEIYRVLRPGGRLYVADITLEDGVDQATVEKLGTWSD
ncbi:MAG: methyltransferase domain-containing protein [Candidatus Brocadiales bacterium]|nr:methyltransferase domain-containing protein [Candidatus Bathyanammoxibius amoris]